jgi:hypothetical protein
MRNHTNGANVPNIEQPSFSKRLARYKPKRPHFETLETRQLLSAAKITLSPADLTLIADASSSTVSGYTPAEMRAAYGFGAVSGTGAGQTIAIIDAYNDPDISSDLNTFDSHFGLASASLKVVNQSGGSSLPGENASAALEESLDVEWAHAMAPGATILLVEANNNGLSNMLDAVEYARDVSGVSVISMSWGSTEFSGEVSYNSDFTTPSGHEGITFVAASGDEGSFDGPDWPAVATNVLGVGGTTLNLSSSGAYESETAWDDSTGGTSRYESEPSYQSSVNTTGNRDTPDVAYDANPETGLAIYDSVRYDGESGWTEVGGTSAGAPSWAGLVAIADQERVAGGLGTLDTSGTLTALYSAASNSTTYAADFNDITSGGGFGAQATTGYDLVTGLGSPKAAGVVKTLVGATASVDVTTVAPVSSGSGSSSSSSGSSGSGSSGSSPFPNGPFGHGGFGGGGFGRGAGRFFAETQIAAVPPTAAVQVPAAAVVRSAIAVVLGAPQQGPAVVSITPSAKATNGAIAISHGTTETSTPTSTPVAPHFDAVAVREGWSGRLWLGDVGVEEARADGATGGLASGLTRGASISHALGLAAAANASRNPMTPGQWGVVVLGSVLIAAQYKLESRRRKAQSR